MNAKLAARPRISLVRLAGAGLVAAIVAAVADVAVYSIGRASGVSMVMPYQWGQPAAVLPISIVVSAVFAAGILATITLGLLFRFTARGVRTFQLVSVPALLVSFAAPLSLAQTAGSTKATLVAMHVVAASGIVVVLSLLGPRTQNR